MLTALTPLGLGAKRSRTWYECAGLYTLAGLVASASVGAALGHLGNAAGASLARVESVVVLAVLAVAIAVRESEVIRFPWPQARRMSRGAWARRWGIRRASLLWGLDIGSFFTTWMTFLGAWWLVAAAVCSGRPAFAAAIFGAHWLGRALVVWLGPALVASGEILPWVATSWSGLHRPFQGLHAGAVLAASVAVAVWH